MHLDVVQLPTATFPSRCSSRTCWGSACLAAWQTRSSARWAAAAASPSGSSSPSWSSSPGAPGRRSSNVSTRQQLDDDHMLHYFTLPVAVIYGILSVESGAHIERADLARFLLDTDGGAVPSSMASLFSEGEKELQLTLYSHPQYTLQLSVKRERVNILNIELYYVE